MMRGRTSPIVGGRAVQTIEGKEKVGASMCNRRVNMRDCTETEVVELSFYDKKTGEVVKAFVVVLDPNEAIINLAVQRDGKIRLYRFLGTKLCAVPLLPDHIASDGAMNMEFWPSGEVTETAETETWPIREVGLMHDPTLADTLRLAGFLTMQDRSAN